MSNFVIIGGGLAGAKTAERLREQGFEGSITIVGDESVLPYERPPLSKDVLLGKADPDSTFVHDEQWYADHDVQVRRGTKALAIDLTGKTVELADGSSIAFDKLTIATGASPRKLDVPGAHLDGVHYLRRLEDCLELRTALQKGEPLVIIGAGWIGLEAAAAARAAGVQTTVVETAAFPLQRAMGAELGLFFAELHRDNGVDLRLNNGVEAIEGETAVTGVRLSDGEVIPAGVVLVGVGVLPNVKVAQGLDIDNGVLADEHLRTSHPDVFVAGDVANAFHPTLGRRIRVDHWANALNQPSVAAAGMLGREAVYDRLPYFYSDQYDVGMEYVGHVDPAEADLVIRGDLASKEFMAFWLVDGVVKAGMNVNIWDVVDDIRALILSGRHVDTTRLADTAVALTDV